MKLTGIFEKMCAISIKEGDLLSQNLAYNLTEIVRRNEQAFMPNTAYWMTTGYYGAYLAFSDDVNGGSLAKFCETMGEKIVNESGFATCRKINFQTEELTVIPAEEFLKTIKELDAVTGENETEILTDDPELYLNSAAYAYRHDEVDELRHSNKWNAYCADSLYYVVDKDFDGTATHDHLSSFSLERTMFVAAATVLNAKDQADYGDKVVVWARLTLGDIPQSVVELAKPIDVKPKALSEFIFNNLIPTAEAEAANGAENTESEEMDRF